MPRLETGLGRDEILFFGPGDQGQGFFGGFASSDGCRRSDAEQHVATIR